MHILVTGGAGYIGSHTVLALLKLDYHVTIIDNFSNSSPKVINILKRLSGSDKLTLWDLDLLNTEFLHQRVSMSLNSFDACIHFAGFKAVGESVNKPMMYYRNNLVSTMNLVDFLKQVNCKHLIFSSSATVYGSVDKKSVDETHEPLVTTNPYGSTKLFIEQMLQDVAKADNSWSIGILRYFNPIGADSSGDIGEDPNGLPNNLLPFMTQVAIGKIPCLKVFGNDYPTHDGTGIRDYIHVEDLANGHVAALHHPKKGSHVYNLGAGKGTSVMEMIEMLRQVSGNNFPYEIVERREGDVAISVADPSKAEKVLGWKTKRTVLEGIRDSWNWQRKHPNGY